MTEIEFNPCGEGFIFDEQTQTCVTDPTFDIPDNPGGGGGGPVQTFTLCRNLANPDETVLVNSNEPCPTGFVPSFGGEGEVPDKPDYAWLLLLLLFLLLIQDEEE